VRIGKIGFITLCVLLVMFNAFEQNIILRIALAANSVLVLTDVIVRGRRMFREYRGN